MAEKVFDPKGMEELHVKDVGAFWLDRKNKKAYEMDGRPVKQGDKLWICPHCGSICWKEIDFAKHMIQKHPEKAKPEKPKKPEK